MLRDPVLPIFGSFMPSSVSAHCRCTVSGFDCLLGFDRQLRCAGEVQIWGRMIGRGEVGDKGSGAGVLGVGGKAAAVRPGGADPAPLPVIHLLAAALAFEQLLS